MTFPTLPEQYNKPGVALVTSFLMLLDEHFGWKLFGSEDALEGVIGFIGTVLVWLVPGR